MLEDCVCVFGLALIQEVPSPLPATDDVRRLGHAHSAAYQEEQDEDDQDDDDEDEDEEEDEEDDDDEEEKDDEAEQGRHTAATLSSDDHAHSGDLPRDGPSEADAELQIAIPARAEHNNPDAARVTCKKGKIRRHNAHYIPHNRYKLTKLVRGLLEITELPFLILWVYFTFFVVISVFAASRVRYLIWVNAAVAGMLVGIGLNANAYRAVMYKGKPDYGMIIRFFLIPFGVSALSGLTNGLREEFLLVFPKDPIYLTIAVCTPAMVVSTLLLTRLIVLWRSKVPISFKNFLFNFSIFA
eukprot:GHVT01081531.1.p1 GENE.GHVT01081531.1~~GHVT01081531.1.p1  ORF type:complete len:298 (-),score=73.48 GHVT01081531.1:1371-2264(-)